MEDLDVEVIQSGIKVIVFLHIVLQDIIIIEFPILVLFIQWKGKVKKMKEVKMVKFGYI